MRKIVTGIMAVLLTGTQVFAADLYQQPEPAPIEAPEITVAESSGWYLRGDAGYAFNHLKGAKFYQGGFSGSDAEFDSAKLRDAFTLGAGVGYQVNNYLRTDLTFDYLFRSKFEGSTSGEGSDFGACVGPCTSRDRAQMTAYSLLANAYVDLGTYGSITPYLGAGIGGTHVKWGNLKNTSCANDGSGCDDTVEHKGKGSWRFTYALMAGASIDVTCNLKADVGYRYRHVEGGNMFGFAENGGPGSDKGFDVHEARVGARYLFSGCADQAYVPAAEPAPQSFVYK